MCMYLTDARDKLFLQPCGYMVPPYVRVHGSRSNIAMPPPTIFVAVPCGAHGKAVHVHQGGFGSLHL
jgi:hypothetical protein